MSSARPRGARVACLSVASISFEQPEDALHLAQGERAAELCAVEASAQQRGSAREAGLDVAAGLPEHRAEGLQRLPIAAARRARGDGQTVCHRGVKRLGTTGAPPRVHLGDEAGLLEPADVVIDGAGRPAQVGGQVARRRGGEGVPAPP